MPLSPNSKDLEFSPKRRGRREWGRCVNIASKGESGARNTAHVVVAAVDQGYPLDRAPSPTPTMLIARSHGEEFTRDRTAGGMGSKHQVAVFRFGHGEEQGIPPRCDHLLCALAAHLAKVHSQPPGRRLPLQEGRRPPQEGRLPHRRGRRLGAQPFITSRSESGRSSPPPSPAAVRRAGGPLWRRRGRWGGGKGPVAARATLFICNMLN